MKLTVVRDIALAAEAASCPNNTFDCLGTGEKCIPYNLVCDGWNDCGDYQDERTDTHDPCPGELFSLLPGETEAGGFEPFGSVDCFRM